MHKTKTIIVDFFNELCTTSFDDFGMLIQKYNISYETLAPYASWSNETYKRICLGRNKDCELVLLCWMPGQATEIHDHNEENCQVYFAKGAFEECIFNQSNPELCIATQDVKEGALTNMHKGGKMHSLKNVSSELAMTLHLYTKPIEECTIYNGDTNQTERVSLSYDVETQMNEYGIIQELKKFVEISCDLVKDEEENPMSERIQADDLHKNLDIKLSDQPIDNKVYYDIVKKVVLATPKTSSKLFFNQLFGGRQSKAVLGDLLAVMLNNSMYTYKVGGVQVGIEIEVINKVKELVGYGNKAGGTFPTGGSMSNFNALLMARDWKDKGSRKRGINTKLVAYTSSESHYSIEKNASFIGLGRDQVRKITCDSEGKMNVVALQKTILKDISNGYTPFFINATAGTTVLGAFDPFIEIAKVCTKHDIWMHIDGAYCGAAIFSAKYKFLMKGVEKSDSFSFNPHKMLGTPMTCSIIVVKDKKHLHTSFNNNAEYLYQTDGDEYNLGKISFQCGRRNDALKLWTLWKSLGTKGLAKIVDTQFELAQVAKTYVENHPDYELYSFDHSVSICFNYKKWSAKELCTKMYEDNKLMIGYGAFKGTEFIRLVTVNANNSKQDILNLFKVIETYS